MAERAGEHLREVEAELGDVLLLVGRADQPGLGRKRLRAEIVLGMDVGDGQVDRPRAGELLRHREDRLAIARTQAGIDHQHRLVADDVTDVRNERHAVVRNDLDVLRRSGLRPSGLTSGGGGEACWATTAWDARSATTAAATPANLPMMSGLLGEWTGRAVYPCSQRA